MKKSSLMGASVVAAALLAAAPVVAPVAGLAVPGTQEVKADNNNYDTHMSEVASKFREMSTTSTVSTQGEFGTYGTVEDFISNLRSIPALAKYNSERASLSLDANTAGADLSSVPLYRNSTNHQNSVVLSSAYQGGWTADTGAVMTDKLLKYFFNGNDQISLASPENMAAAAKMSYTLNFEYNSAIGDHSYAIRNANDVKNTISDLEHNGGSVTLSLQLYDGNNWSMGDAGLMKSTVKYNVVNQKAAYVDYTDTLNAHVGDSANLYGLSNSFVNANGVIRNYNGEDITDSAYKAGAIVVNPLRDSNGHKANQSGAIVNGNFAKPGKYYQNIVIHLPNAGVKVPGNDWEAAANGGLVSVNGQVPSVTNADANVYLVTNSKHKTNVNGQDYSAGDLILKRTVNVDVNQGAFKTDKINGKVTVNMNDGMAAQVYDENGKQVLGRALPNKSAWKTIEKRTYYKDGQVFYQVSTNEYVKAQDVVFTEYSSSSNDNDPLSGKVNVTKYPSKVINILNDGYAAGVYAINEDGQGMHQVIGRFLPSGSAWINQGTAEVNGNLFYQVSTNEWVSANSVVK